MMPTVGRESAPVSMELQRLKAKRVKRGECPDCGTMLYKTGMLGRIQKKKAIHETCQDGRCLVCEPREARLRDPMDPTPVSPDNVEPKTAKSVPRIILTYQAGNGDSGDLDLRLLGLDMDDAVSDITLDRRIRTNGDNVDVPPQQLDEESDRSLSKMPPGWADKKRSSSSSKRRIGPELNMNEPLRIRMEQLLRTDATPELRPVRISFHNVPEEEIDPLVEDTKAEGLVETEKTKFHSEGRPTAAHSLPGKIPPNSLQGHSIEPPSMRKHPSETPDAILKKVFRPNNVFVSQESFIHSTMADEAYPHNIIIERPEGALHASRNSGDFILETEADDCAVALDTSEHAIHSQPSHTNADSTHPSNVAEIVFDLGAISPFGDNQKKMKSGPSGSQPRSLRNLADDDEVHCVTEDSAPMLHQDYATVDSSHHDTAEYSAYSSKLLMMLDESDFSNPSSGGWPSLRIPRIRSAASGGGDEHTNTHDSSYHGMETGNVFVETGIPKVVYSSNAESSDHKRMAERSSVDGHSKASSAREASSMKSIDNIGLPIPPSIPNASSDNHSRASSAKKPPPLPMETRKPPPQKLDLPYGQVSSISDTLKKALFQLEHGQLNDRESVLLHLTEILWNEDGVRHMTVQQLFVQENGAKILATTMWASMSLPNVIRAALGLFFALIASPILDMDHVWNDDLGSLIDALLITMQTLVDDIEVQKDACRIFGCLASTGNENDGTQSGACLAVLNAMDAHRNVESVQEWGLRALYNQCLCSKQAETNKRIVLTSRLDTSGSTGNDVLERVIGYGKHHLRTGGVLEWACRLFWCLTASKSSVSDLVSFRMDTIRELLHILEACRSTSDASPQLQEATLGLIANLVRRDQCKSFLGTPDVILLILDTMLGNKEFVEVQIEACNAIANISCLLAPVDRAELVGAGVIQTVVGAMFAFPREKFALQEPALRALLGLAFECEVAKVEISERKTLCVILHICHMDEDSTLPQQEYLCALLASLYMGSTRDALECDSLGALTDAIGAFPNSEKICDSACCAFRNLSSEESNFEALLEYSAIGYAIRSMATFVNSKSIQMNCCCILRNLSDGVDIGAQIMADADCMKYVVSAIQTHLDTMEVLDAACGAIWSMIHHSPVLRQDFLNSATGLESVICILVMHPGAVSLMETVCGILAFSSRSLRGTPPAVLSSGAINMVETMCNNSRSHVILQHGAHFLRNLLASNPQFVSDALTVIGVVMNALKDAGSSNAFLGETLYFLWFISELSYEAKSKIIAMDGIPLTMAILDHFRGVPFVEDPGLGLFRELEQESSRR